MRARVDALASFSHPAFARVRALTLLDDPSPQLALVSELAAGERLSTVLRAAEAGAPGSTRRAPSGCCASCCRPWRRFTTRPAGRRIGCSTPTASSLTAAGEIAITEYVFGGLAGGPAADAPHDRRGTGGAAGRGHSAWTPAWPRRVRGSDFERLVHAGVRDVAVGRCPPSVADARADAGAGSVPIGARGLSRARRTAARRLGQPAGVARRAGTGGYRPP